MERDEGLESYTIICHGQEKFTFTAIYICNNRDKCPHFGDQFNGLVERCYNLSVPDFPLEGNKIPGIFKIYFADTGLMVASLDEGTAGHILSGDMGVYKGAIYEESFADAYLKKGKKLYYFSKESGLKIVFILQSDEGVRLLEVKAKDGRTKAASELLKNKEKYRDVKGLIRLKDSNVGSVDNIATYPTYMSFLIP